MAAAKKAAAAAKKKTGGAAIAVVEDKPEAAPAKKESKAGLAKAYMAANPEARPKEVKAALLEKFPHLNITDNDIQSAKRGMTAKTSGKRGRKPGSKNAPKPAKFGHENNGLMAHALATVEFAHAVGGIAKAQALLADLAAIRSGKTPF